MPTPYPVSEDIVSFMQSPSKAAARAVLDVPATGHTHTTASISDSGAVGRALLQAATAAVARASLLSAELESGRLVVRDAGNTTRTYVDPATSRTVAGNILIGGGHTLVHGTKASLIPTDGGIVVARELTGSLSNGAHGFRDESTYTMSGGGFYGYASYDALVAVTSAGTVNHVRGFQSRPVFDGGGGTCQQLAGLDVGVTSNGTTTNVEGICIRDALGSGAVNLQTGIRVMPLTKGVTNLSLAVEGATSISQINGQLQLIGGNVSNGPTTGDLRVWGGIGVGANVNVTGYVNASGAVLAGTQFQIGATKVVGSRVTGFPTMTGTATYSSIATYDAAVISGTYSQSQVQAIATALQELSRRVKALDDSLRTHGLIGT